MRRLSIGVIAGVAVFAGFSIYADVNELGDRLSHFAWSAFAAALGLALLNYVLRFIRWQIYLRRIDVSLPTALSARIFLSGFALSVTPGKLGELVKSYLLREARGVPIARSAPLVLAERVTDLLALLILGVIGVSIYGVARTMIVAGACTVAALLVMLSWPPLAHLGIRIVTALGPTKKLRPRLFEFYDGLAALVRPRPLTWATAIAALAWLAECAGFALIIGGFAGTAVPFGSAILIYAATTVAGALSFLPGGLLVTEAGMTLLLVQSSSGVDQADRGSRDHFDSLGNAVVCRRPRPRRHGQPSGPRGRARRATALERRPVCGPSENAEVQAGEGATTR